MLRAEVMKPVVFLNFMTLFQQQIQRLFFAIRKYPAPIFFSFLAFMLVIFEMHGIRPGGFLHRNMVIVKLILECVSGISLFAAFDVYRISRQINSSTRWGLYLLGGCILGLHYYSIPPSIFDKETVYISRYLIFAGAYHLLVSGVAFNRSNEINAFWQYNTFLFFRFFTVLLYTLTLYAGLAGAVWGINALFDSAWPDSVFYDLAAFIFLPLQTTVFFMGFPEKFSSFSEILPFRKSFKVLLQYVLIPLIGLYTIILYFYLFQIVITRELPDGTVCIPILIYAGLGILAYLLTYPIQHESSEAIARIFTRNFFYVLIPLLVVYFVAIVLRIKPYGITEDRYSILAIGIWLSFISIYLITSPQKNIVVIPMSLFIILFISAIGPWGMFQLSVRNQHARLERLLNRNQLLQNKKLIRTREDKDLSDSDVQSIHSILSYLNKRSRIRLIEHWLGESERKMLIKAEREDELFAVNAIFTGKGIAVDTTKALTLEIQPDSAYGFMLPLPLDSFQRALEFSYLMDQEFNGLHVVPNGDVSGMHFVFQQDTVGYLNVQEVCKKLIAHYYHQEKLRTAKNEFDHAINLESDQIKNLHLHRDSLVFQHNRGKVFLRSISIYHVKQSNTVVGMQGYFLY